MSSTLLDISTKIDSATVSLLRDFAAETGDISWLMIGATARDVFLYYEYENPIQRATKDIDFGVQLGSWDDYDELRTRLLNCEKFKSTTVQHRLIHRNGLPLDLIPFGGLASVDNRIKWSSGSSGEMDVTGYNEVLKAAISVKVASNPDLVVPVASLAGVALLKILAWADNSAERTKDAIDLAHLMDRYLDLGNWDRLNKDDADLTNSEGFKIQLAGAELLGRDIARISSAKTLQAVTSVIKRELDIRESSKMVQAISKTLTMKSFSDCAELLSGLRHGLER